ncbi:phosphoenolpyruvate--protein phosphotransferase [bacterium endosymbiont of Pedicinus badii]|uniref:phosphoenolpyruvate--protein phosphotransferase n=1 Tax=bacterium endosymbiont of Pedicinus badii TaxID=1719126 RepID=UPI0009BBC37D|nr:phosphoenolpyruvate--protein phosphotransferase [bacterium endosymbiont of Pedicinus badii]OQM34512.1 phosphoenolpyruvate-protein phosphotransferase [bacterium endosymbiont of Pedicinus badii]
MISGILASPGISFGKALLLKEKKISFKKKYIKKEDIEGEIKRFFIAREKSCIQISKIRDRIKKFFGKEKSEIFDSHILLLQDEELEKKIVFLIEKKLYTPEYSINLAIEEQIKKIEKLKNAYLKERIIDLQDIKKRILQNIFNFSVVDLSTLKKEVILISKDLTPSDIAQANFKKILGILTDVGGTTSHTSIIAKSLEIPAIVGIGNITKIVKNGDFISIDAINNRIYINPKKNEFQKIKKIKIKYEIEKKNLQQDSKLPCITIDNHKIKICANIGNIFELKNIEKSGAEGIGLYRTEFIFMNRNSLPNEEEQFLEYKSLAQSFKNEIVIRTLDVGGDKEISCINFPKENNPFLGWRGIRICLDKIEILRTQLRAIFRASVFGKLKIMYPMISSLEEVYALKKEIEILKLQLNKECIKFDKNIKIGLMIETPAAAILSENLAQEVDFFSIGTNDLTQYTLAVDRGNEYISHLYNPISPSVLKLIKMVIEASHKYGKKTSICGELANDENAAILLVGMGIDELSMNISSIKRVKKVIRSINYKDAKKISQLAIFCKTNREIMNLLDTFKKEKKIK